MGNSEYDLIMRKLREKYKEKGATETESNTLASQNISQQEAQKQLNTDNEQPLETQNFSQDTDFSTQVEDNTKDLYENANWWQKLNMKIGQYGVQFGYGFLKSFEGILDLATTGLAAATEGVGRIFGQQGAGDSLKWFTNLDLSNYAYDNPVTKGILTYQIGAYNFGENYNPWETANIVAERQLDEDWGDKIFSTIGGALGQYVLANAASSVGSSVGGAAASTAGASATGTAKAAATGARVAQDITMFASAAGNTAASALSEGKDYGEALGYGALSGAIEVATERFVDKGLEAIRGGLGKLFKGADKLFTSGGTTSAWFTGSKGATNIASKLISEFDEEGWEEVVGDLLEPLAQMITTDKGKSYSELFMENGGFTQLVEDYFLGGIGGLFMGGTQYAGSIIQQGKTNTQLQGYLEQVHSINEEIQNLQDKDVEGSNSLKIQALEARKNNIKNLVLQNFKSYLDERRSQAVETIQYDTYQNIRAKAQASLDELSNSKNPNLAEIIELNSFIEGLDQNAPAKPEYYDTLDKKTKQGIYLATYLDNELDKNNTLDNFINATNEVGLESTDVRGVENLANEEDLSSSSDKIQNTITLSPYQINNPITEETEDTLKVKGYDKTVRNKNALKTYLHEFFHIASRTNSKNLVDSVLESLESDKDAYNALYNETLETYKDTYTDTEIKKTEYWDEVKDNPDLDENQKIEEARKRMIREEMAADRFAELFKNTYEFKKAIKSSNFKGLFKLQTTLTQLFGKGKNRAKPDNYYEIMALIKQGIKESEIREKENLDKKLDKSSTDERFKLEDLEAKKQLLFEEENGKLYVRYSVTDNKRVELHAGDVIKLDYTESSMNRVIGKGNHRHINALNTGFGHYAYVDKNGEIQNLQPADVWKLQGFKSNDLTKAIVKGNATLRDIFRVTGNSMTKYVMEAVLSKLPLSNDVKIIEYFGGIGASRMALRDLGYNVTTLDYREINDRAVNIYNAIFNEQFNTKDIRQSNETTEQADILIHGSPCVDFSNLKGNRRKGGLRESGSESSLMWSTIDRLYEMKEQGILPKYVVWENVANVQTEKYEKEFKSYIATMEELGYKYNTWDVLNSIDFGVPQTRKRSFVISSLEDINYTFEKGNPENTPDFIDFIDSKSTPTIEKDLKADKRLKLTADSDVRYKKEKDNTKIIEIFNSVNNDNIDVSKIDSTYGRLKSLKSHFEKEAEKHKKAPLGYSNFEEFKGQQVVTDAFLLGVLSPEDMIPLGDVKKSEHDYPKVKPILDSAKGKAEIKTLYSNDVNGILKAVNNVDKENAIFGILDTDTNTAIYFDKKLFKAGIELLNAKNEELSVHFSHNDKNYGSSIRPILLQKNNGTEVLILPVRMDERSSTSKIDDVGLYNLKTSEAFIPRAKYEDLIDLETTKEIVDKIIANEKNKKVPKQFEETNVDADLQERFGEDIDFKYTRVLIDTFDKNLDLVDKKGVFDEIDKAPKAKMAIRFLETCRDFAEELSNESEDISSDIEEHFNDNNVEAVKEDIQKYKSLVQIVNELKYRIDEYYEEVDREGDYDNYTDSIAEKNEERISDADDIISEIDDYSLDDFEDNLATLEEDYLKPLQEQPVKQEKEQPAEQTKEQPVEQTISEESVPEKKEINEENTPKSNVSVYDKIQVLLSKPINDKTKDKLNKISQKILTNKELVDLDYTTINTIEQYGEYLTAKEISKLINEENKQKLEKIKPEIEAVEETLKTIRAGGALKGKYDYAVSNEENISLEKLLEIRGDFEKSIEKFNKALSDYHTAYKKIEIGDDTELTKYDKESMFTNRLETLNRMIQRKAKIEQKQVNLKALDTLENVDKNISENLSIEDREIYMQQNKALNEKISSIEEEMSKLEKQVEKTQNKLNAAKDTIKSMKQTTADQEKLQAENDKLTTEIEKIRKEKKNLYNTLRFLKTRYTQSRQNLWENIKAKGYSIKKYQETLNNLTKELIETEQNSSNLVTRLIVMHNEAETQIKELKVELRTAAKENERLEREKQRLLKKQATAEKKLQQEKDSLKRLKNENKSGWKATTKGVLKVRDILRLVASTFSNSNKTEIESAIDFDNVRKAMEILSFTKDKNVAIQEANDIVLEMLGNLSIDVNGESILLKDALDGVEDDLNIDVEQIVEMYVKTIDDGKELSDTGRLRKVISEISQKYKERGIQFTEYRYIQAIKNTTRSTVKAFSTLKENNKFANTHSEYNKAIEEFIASIKKARKDKAIKDGDMAIAILDFYKSYQSFKEDILVPLPSYMVELVAEIGDENLPARQRYQRIYKFLAGFKRYLKSYTGQAYLVINGKVKTISDFANRGIQETKDIKPRKWNPVYSTYAPRIVFDVMSNGKEDSLLMDVYNEIEKGQNKQMESYIDMYGDLIKFSRTENGKDVMKELSKKGKRHLVTIEYGNGKKFTARASQLLSFYELSKREHAKDSIALKGVSITGNNVIKFGVEATANAAEQNQEIGEQIKQIESQISSLTTQISQLSGENKNITKKALENRKRDLREQIKALKEQQNANTEQAHTEALEEIDSLVKGIVEKFDLDYENSKYSQYIKEVEDFFKKARKFKEMTDYQVKGFSNVEEGHYFPISTSQFSLQENLTEGNFNADSMLGAIEQSFNQDVKGNAVVELKDVEHITETHAKNMSVYVGFAPILESFSRIYNTRFDGGVSFGKVLESSFVADNNRNDTKKPTKYFVKLFMDIQGMKSQKSETDKYIDGFVNTLRSNFASVALFGNFKVMISQLASIPAAAKYLGNKLWVGIREMNSKSIPEIPKSAQYRNMSRSVIEAETLNAKTKKVAEVFGKGINWFDKQAIKVIWAATANQDFTLRDGTTTTLKQAWAKLKSTPESSYQYENAKATYEEIYRLALTEFNKSVNETQPNFNSLGRSELLRTDSDIAKLFLMFKSQASQNWSNAVELYYMVKNKKTNFIGNGKEDKKARRMLMGLILQAILYTFIGQLFQHIKKNDWKEITWNSELSNFGVNLANENLLGMIPILDQIEIDLDAKYKISSNMSTGWLGTYVEAVSNALNGSSNADDLVKLVSYTFGIPLSNMYTYTKAIVQYVAPEFTYMVDSWYRGADITDRSTLNSAINYGNGSVAYKQYTSDVMQLNDNTLSTMYELYKEGYLTSNDTLKVAVRSVPDVINYDEIEIPVIKEKFAKTYSMASKSLDNLTKSLKFKSLTKEYQAKAITYLLNLYYSIARKQFTGQDLSMLEYLLLNGYNLTPKQIIALSEIKYLESDEKSTKKEKTQTYISEQKMASAEKYFLYLMSGYSLKKEKLAYARKYLTDNGFSYKKARLIIGA